MEDQEGQDVQIVQLSGETICRISVDIQGTVRDLKETLAGILQVPEREQQLSYEGGGLCDKDLLQGIHVSGDVRTLMLTVCPWTDEELEAKREELNRTIREQDMDALEKVLTRMPYNADDKASVLGCTQDCTFHGEWFDLNGERVDLSDKRYIYGVCLVKASMLPI